MSSEEKINITIFSDSSKRIITSLIISIFLIIIFVISPLNKFKGLSFIMKIAILCILIYSIYLNIIQTNILIRANEITNNEIINTQLSTNINTNYILSFSLGLLIIFIIKSFI